MTFHHKFAYGAEKLAAARRSLMLPHYRGEAQSIANACHECSLGLKDVLLDDLDANARGWAKTIQLVVEAKGTEDPHGEGTWIVHARTLTQDQQQEFSSAVDSLADWFDRSMTEPI
jgi:hypothetical protein